MNLDLVHPAIAPGELPPETDADLVIDALRTTVFSANHGVVRQFGDMLETGIRRAENE